MANAVKKSGFTVILAPSSHCVIFWALNSRYQKFWWMCQSILMNVTFRGMGIWPDSVAKVRRSYLLIPLLRGLLLGTRFSRSHGSGNPRFRFAQLKRQKLLNGIRFGRNSSAGFRSGSDQRQRRCRRGWTLWLVLLKKAQMSIFRNNQANKSGKQWATLSINKGCVWSA